ncbi:hypothetical protein L1987_42539 [Smallanthus sonchifolius]|uniref:Uncharacterized protein n=1 Tax=Smallanthus sonchifolius TaxID=185202 RepID=A0ACB9GJS4_9ASTR|nr:hypothetical protein L1987_42539 [Smallanthus sonchifolius]
MFGGEDNTIPPQPPAAAAAGGGGRKTYSLSVSWAGISPVNTNPRNSKSRACLAPLLVSRPKSMGWENVTTTPRTNLKPGFEYDKECSRIIDHVFLGSDSVAKDRDVLRVNGITHVLNCVGFACPEYFKKDLVYKTLWLRDTPTEDITIIRYERAIGQVLRVSEGEEPSEFWGAFLSEKEVVVCLSERRVVDYDLDFEIFDKAVKGGVVPPFSIMTNNHEMCLPARQSGWGRLRRKFTNGVMKEFMDHEETYEDDYAYESSESRAFSVKRFKKVY